MITRLEVQISKLKNKPEIMLSDSVRIQAHTVRFISLDSDFKKYHFHNIELVDEEDKEPLGWQQALLDDHDDRMNDIIDRLTQLGHTEPRPIVVAPRWV